MIEYRNNWLYKELPELHHSFSCLLHIKSQTTTLFFSPFCEMKRGHPLLFWLAWHVKSILIDSLTLINERQISDDESTTNHMQSAIIEITTDKQRGGRETRCNAWHFLCVSWGQMYYLYLSVSTSAAIGQFGGPNSPVRSAKFESWFCFQTVSWFLAKCS